MESDSYVNLKLWFTNGKHFKRPAKFPNFPSSIWDHLNICPWHYFISVAGCQFHQWFTLSLYVRRSQMRRKDSQVTSVVLRFLGPTSVKAVRKMLMKSTPDDFWKSVQKCYGTGKFVFSRDLKVTIIADL